MASVGTSRSVVVGSGGGGGSEAPATEWKTHTVSQSADIAPGTAWTIPHTPYDSNTVFMFVDGVFYSDQVIISGSTIISNFNLQLFGNTANLTFKYRKQV